ncbi:Longitudinals lacking protein, isoforms F/I/K/T [Frankliniella fusca]|uniref:Longitudinals lacking protein, isoforms F/I/K/T n=1 Tax=Frankliniella fusca TaxID=407009 RepID=A0AAE1LCX8_9NEOP|nr:Longitudinals lacking protein, isoforms F/I/K/T [Frankliniella fusca]
MRPDDTQRALSWPHLSTSNELSPLPNLDGSVQEKYRCLKCGKEYRWKQSLMLHLRQECGKEPQFQCPYCQHRSKRRGNLKGHVLRSHPEQVFNWNSSF